jgi:hypothetical protein
MKERVIRITDPIYNIPVIIVIAEYTVFNDWLYDTYKLPREEQKFFGGMTMDLIDKKNGGIDIIVWFPSFRNHWAFWEKLVHELYHATQRAVSAINQDKRLVGEEAAAYYMEYLFREAKHGLLKNSGKKK